MSLLSQSNSLARLGARWRSDLYGVRVTLGSDTDSRQCSKSPSKATRTSAEQGTGYIQRVIATFMSSPTWPVRPALGSEFTITASPENPADIGTRWRAYDVTLAASGEEDRSVCFRLD